MQAQTQMQIEFEKFLTLFPEYEWNDLQALFIKGSETSEFSYEDYRKNIWYVEPQNGPDNVFNHIRNVQYDEFYGSKTTPHIKTKDGKKIKDSDGYVMLERNQLPNQKCYIH